MDYLLSTLCGEHKTLYKLKEDIQTNTFSDYDTKHQFQLERVCLSVWFNVWVVASLWLRGELLSSINSIFAPLLLTYLIAVVCIKRLNNKESILCRINMLRCQMCNLNREFEEKQHGMRESTHHHHHHHHHREGYQYIYIPLSLSSSLLISTFRSPSIIQKERRRYDRRDNSTLYLSLSMNNMLQHNITQCNAGCLVVTPKQ